MNRKLLTALLLVVVTTPLFGWAEKGHTIVNEAATFGVPNEMPPFFHAAYPELVYLAFDPDRWRGAGPSLDSVNPPDHFLDYEYVSDLKLPIDRYEYLHLLETSGTLRRFAVSNSTSGFLPWRIAELSDLLTSQWRLWRRTDEPITRRQIERNIIVYAGVLGHFVGDSSNPHHASIEYNGWTSANPNHYRTDCETHERFERDFVTRTMTPLDVEPLLSALRLRTDYFAAGLESVRQSNALVEALYTIDRDGGFDSQQGTPESREFTARRLAAGASLLRDLWWSAWKNSERKK